MPSEIVNLDGQKYLHYSNGFFKERTELLQTCLEETNERILAFQRIRPTLEAYLSKRIGGHIELKLDGSIEEGACNSDSDIDLRIQFPARGRHESHLKEIEAIVRFYDEWENDEVNDLNIDMPYRLHFLRNI